MRNLADYRLLRNPGFRLFMGSGQDRIEEFNSPELKKLTNSNSNYQEPFLSFNASPNLNVAKIDIDINGHPIATGMTIKGQDISRVIQLGFRNSLLEKNAPNTVTFRIMEGDCNFGDVILWFQQDL